MRIRICFGILFHYEIYETFGHVVTYMESRIPGGIDKIGVFQCRGTPKFGDEKIKMLFRLDSEKLSGTTTYYIIFMSQLILAEYIYIYIYYIQVAPAHVLFIKIKNKK